jgi:hypothetical protein
VETLIYKGDIGYADLLAARYNILVPDTLS